MQDFILKVDLVKAYDWVDWSLIKFMLIQIYLIVEVTNWIMAYISLTYFVVMINGEPSPYFSCNRGLR